MCIGLGSSSGSSSGFVKYVYVMSIACVIMSGNWFLALNKGTHAIIFRFLSGWRCLSFTSYERFTWLCYEHTVCMLVFFLHWLSYLGIMSVWLLSYCFGKCGTQIVWLRQSMLSAVFRSIINYTNNISILHK